jgi:hypothetical protein
VGAVLGEQRRRQRLHHRGERLGSALGGLLRPSACERPLANVTA